MELADRKSLKLRLNRTDTVKLAKRLDLARDANRAEAAVPGLIVANWLAGRFAQK